MTTRYLAIAAAPLEEEHSKAGQPDHTERSRLECRIFQRMLERRFPAPNDHVHLVVRCFPHSYGTYREVEACFDDQDEAACEYAYRLERETPAKWDAIALYELQWLERKERFSRSVARGEITSDEIPAQYRPADFPALPADKTLPELCRLFPF